MSYPKGFKHIEKEWFSETHHHYVENYLDESTGEILGIERKQPYFRTIVGLN